MDSKLVMDNYLLILKSTVEVYVHGTLESSNESNKMLLNTCLNKILDCQKNTYNLMTKYGWYNVNNVDSNVINETLIKIENK